MPDRVRGVRAAASSESPSLYERIGADKVKRFVAAFYVRVDSDPVIRPLYGKTLTCAIHGLTNFMKTWLGGPPVYDLSGAEALLDHGATIDACDSKGQTPLRRAVNCRQLQIIRLLVRCGPTPTRRTAEGDAARRSPHRGDEAGLGRYRTMKGCNPCRSIHVGTDPVRPST